MVCVTTARNDAGAADGYEVEKILSDLAPCDISISFIFLPWVGLIRQRGATHLVLEHPYYGWLGVLLKMGLRRENWWCIRIIWRACGGRGWASGGGQIRGLMSDGCIAGPIIISFIQEEDRAICDRAVRAGPGALPGDGPMGSSGRADRPRKRSKRAGYGCGRNMTSARGKPSRCFSTGHSIVRPNLGALRNILEQDQSHCYKERRLAYRILICGKGYT